MGMDEIISEAAEHKSCASIILSIIIPVYNCKNYIDQCLNSILCHREVNIEIICIDDCSSDESSEILEEYARRDGRISVLHNTENMGLSESRNRGIRKANGQYIWFVDADDWIDKDAIERILEYLQSYDPEILLFHSLNVNETTGDKGVWNDSFCTEYNVPMNGTAFFNKSIQNNGRLSSAVWIRCYRRDFLLEGKLFFPAGIIHEDITHSTEALLQADKVVVVDDKLYIHRTREGSLSQSPEVDSSRVASFCYIIGRFISIEQDNSDPETKNSLRVFIGTLCRMIYNKMRYMDSIDRRKLDPEFTPYLILCSFGWYEGFFPFLLSPQDMKRIRNAKSVIIYGAKSLADNLNKLLSDRNVKVDCFAASAAMLDQNDRETKICPIEEINPEEGTLLLIAAEKTRVQEEMRQYALKLGFREESIMMYRDMVMLCSK